MKGFKNSTKTQQGHSFPTTAGFTGSSGQISSVRSYTRKAPTPRERAQDAMGNLPQELSSIRSSMDAVADRLPKRYAEGGSVGNSATLRRDPVTEFDKDYGGKTPLRPGFKKGGKIKHNDAAADIAMMKKEIPKMVKPTALKGRGFRSTPLIGK